MQIDIKHTYEYPTYYSVTIDGFCNHFGERESTIEETEYGYSREVIRCVNCNAEYNDLDERWIV